MEEIIIEILKEKMSDELKAKFIINLFNKFMLDTAEISERKIDLMNNLFIKTY